MAFCYPNEVLHSGPVYSMTFNMLALNLVWLQLIFGDCFGEFEVSVYRLVYDLLIEKSLLLHLQNT